MNFSLKQFAIKMTSIKETDFNAIKTEFYGKASNILSYKSDKKRKMTTDPEKIEQYKNEVVEKYNAMAQLAESIYEGLKQNEQEKLVNSFTQYYRPRLLQALEFIGYVFEMPQRFGTIDIAKVQKISEGTATGGGDDDDDFEWDGFEEAMLTQVGPNGSQQTETTKTDKKLSKTQLTSTTGAKSRFAGMTPDDFENKFSFAPQHFASNRGKGTNTYNSAGNRNVNSNFQSRTFTNSDFGPKSHKQPNFDMNFNPHSNLGSRAQPSTNFRTNFRPNADNDSDSHDDESQEYVNQISEINFYNLCARTFTEAYAGDPLALKPFINQINMAQRMCQNDGHEAILKDFIMSHVKGLASDILPADPDSIETIKKTLLAKIKPENSKVVKGKLMALKADRNNLTEYTKKAEQLAQSLKRSLILENIPYDNANKMVIDDTIELCRANTNSVLVKASLINPTAFKDAREVLAQYVIETRKDDGEKRILSLGQTNSNSNRNSGNNSQRRGNGRNYYQNQNRNQYQNRNYQNNGYNRNYYQSRGNSRGYGNSNGNGRGRGGNHRGRGNNNWQYPRQNRTYYYAENDRAPPSGAAQTQNVQSNQADRQ